MNSFAKVVGLLVAAALFFLASVCCAQLHEAFIPTKESAVRDWCFANQRVVASAVEMYNMDNEEYISNFEDRFVREPGFLIPEYLKNPISQEYGCHYSSEGDLAHEGVIVCSVHGAKEGFNASQQTLEDFKSASQKLVAAGYTVDGADEDGVTALHLAVELEEPLLVEYLLSLKADPLLQTSKGYNVLDCAVQKKNLEIAQILKKHGAVCSQTVIDAAQKEAASFNVVRLSGDVQIKTEDVWQLVNKSASYSLPITIRSGENGRSLFSLGESTSVELVGKSEVAIEKPAFDTVLPIVTSKVLHLINGEMRLSNSSFQEGTGMIKVLAGDKIIAECGSGKFKFTYDSARNLGTVVVKVGRLKLKSLTDPENQIDVPGFYKVEFDQGNLREKSQAFMTKEFY
ncbi:MAG: ankyrin repeat domain-containing protein [Candidatus Riflebacteria bacterium]|nr:ankyrin repeat domain-containing protein [Candidatus Riflebacteria bacterium]